MYLHTFEHVSCSSIIHTEGFVFAPRDDEVVVCCNTQHWLSMPALGVHNAPAAGVNKIDLLVEASSDDKISLHMQV